MDMICDGCGENSFRIPDDDDEWVICNLCGRSYAKLKDLKRRVEQELAKRPADARG